MAVTALCPWFGGARMVGPAVGRALEGCKFVSVPFCGGLPELLHIKCRTGVANDLHRHLINLVRVAADRELGPKLWRRLRRLAFHPDTLAAAQRRCLLREEWAEFGVGPMTPDAQALWNSLPADGRLQWAEDYFYCAWVGRNGMAGTDSEFRGGPAFRWDAAGGDSAVRFQSAIRGLWRPWRQVLSRWTFDCRDAFEFLKKIKNRPGDGCYVDSPWPDDGDGYRHKFTEEHQRRLAATLLEYPDIRIVVRFGDHPLIRELYPESAWIWNRQTGRTASNKEKAEVLLVNRSSQKEACNGAA